jgi:hypothetical protein
MVRLATMARRSIHLSNPVRGRVTKVRIQVGVRSPKQIECSFGYSGCECLFHESVRY